MVGYGEKGRAKVVPQALRVRLDRPTHAACTQRTILTAYCQFRYTGNLKEVVYKDMVESKPTEVCIVALVPTLLYSSHPDMLCLAGCALGRPRNVAQKQAEGSHNGTEAFSVRGCRTT